MREHADIAAFQRAMNGKELQLVSHSDSVPESCAFYDSKFSKRLAIISRANFMGKIACSY
jgi:hypothetical protein